MTVFFGGAGVSTESGIPDFRSAGGLYNDGGAHSYAPEEMLSRDFFMEHTPEFYEFYRTKMIHQNAKPNAAHLALARMEANGRLDAVITQNIDGLHQMAGSVNVIELHGSVYRNFCMACGKSYGLDFVLRPSGVPCCECGGTVKPDVVLYQEQLDSEVIEKAVSAISAADLLIVGGTSLSVYPAANMIRYFRGGRLILINRTETQMDHLATEIIRANIGEALSELADKL